MNRLNTLALEEGRRNRNVAAGLVSLGFSVPGAWLALVTLLKVIRLGNGHQGLPPNHDAWYWQLGWALTPDSLDGAPVFAFVLAAAILPTAVLFGSAYRAQLRLRELARRVRDERTMHDIDRRLDERER